jgi:hypothetical protein
MVVCNPNSTNSKLILAGLAYLRVKAILIAHELDERLIRTFEENSIHTLYREAPAWPYLEALDLSSSPTTWNMHA